jgi:O-antigen ligase
LLRRVLLALMTALVVARPLVLGEDPGLLDRLSSSSGLVLSMLWFAAAAGWAAWLAWSRQGIVRLGWIEVGFAVVVALVFTTAAAAAHYKHPAMLIAWEWVAFLLAFSLVRQLVRTPQEGHSLLAAILATAVSLSGHAIYQYTVEMPRDRAMLEDPEKLRQELAKIHIHLEPNDPYLATYQKRLQENNVFATYAHPNSFAGFLALTFPAAVGWMLVSRKQYAWHWRTLLAACLVVLLGTALWMTHSRGAILALLMVGGVVLVIYGHRMWWPYRAWVAAGIAVLAVAVFMISRTEWGAIGFEKARHSFGLRTEYWAATWRMIADHPFLGVGPGNFGRHYPRYMAETAHERIQDPHNFALEMWATCGILALVALLGTWAAFFRGARGERREARDDGRDPNTATVRTASRPPPLAPRPSPLAPLRWEFYLGGMAGLILGFMLRAADRSAEDVIMEGLLSGGRSLLWFAAFALLDNIPWIGPSQGLALTAGVAALLLNLSVSGGVTQPSVAVPMWVMAALALNSSTSQPALWQPRSWLAWLVPFPVLAGVAVAYFLLVFYPVTSCAAALAEARRHYGEGEGMPGWHNQVKPQWLDQLEHEKSSQKKLQALQAPNAYLKNHILTPLIQATTADPGNATPWVELTRWYGEQAKLYRDGSESSRDTISSARRAQQLDPDGKEGYLAEYQIRIEFAKLPGADAREHYLNAARALEAVVMRDPTDAPLHYLFADMLFRTDDPVNGREHAETARKLDQLDVTPARHLTEAQREQIQKWLMRSRAE